MRVSAAPAAESRARPTDMTAPLSTMPVKVPDFQMPKKSVLGLKGKSNSPAFTRGRVAQRSPVHVPAAVHTNEGVPDTVQTVLAISLNTLGMLSKSLKVQALLA